MSDVKLMLGDCLELMKAIPDGSVDCVITDPPYGISIARKSNNHGARVDLSRKASGGTWDDVIPTREYFYEMNRIGKNQIIFGANYFWEYLCSTKCYIIWDKRKDLPDVPFSPMEFAWTSFDRMPKKIVLRNHGFIKDSKDERSDHPTQKPSELMIEIVRDFTNPGDTILDPFMGSGSTGVACVKLNRNFIGCEISPAYFAIAEKRIADAQLQIPMDLT